MGVSPDDVRRIAALAALRLDDDEADRLTRDLNDILGHFEVLRDADTGGHGGTGGHGETEGHGGTEGASLRPDEPGADPLARGAGDGAPDFRDGLFTVPRLASHAGEEDGPGAAGTPPPAGGSADDKAP
ncbi:MAG: aspartyl/glutamyl-tRNA amidotransferase subunit C [Longimicrobiales bacterium]